MDKKRIVIFSDCHRDYSDNWKINNLSTSGFLSNRLFQANCIAVPAWPSKYIQEMKSTSREGRKLEYQEIRRTESWWDEYSIPQNLKEIWEEFDGFIYFSDFLSPRLLVVIGSIELFNRKAFSFGSRESQVKRISLLLSSSNLYRDIWNTFIIYGLTNDYAKRSSIETEPWWEISDSGASAVDFVTNTKK